MKKRNSALLGAGAAVALVLGLAMPAQAINLPGHYCDYGYDAITRGVNAFSATHEQQNSGTWFSSVRSGTGTSLISTWNRGTQNFSMARVNGSGLTSAGTACT